MQYQEKKERIAKGDSDRTEQDINDIRIIEQVAAETCGKNRDFMIQYVATGGIPEKDIPLPIAIFREQRRNFFIRLSDEMERRDRDIRPGNY